MNRLEQLNIQERPVTMALLHYDDYFYDAALRKYSFKEALHVYLKRNGYKTIVFFSIGNGIHSFEKEMLETFLKTKNDAPANDESKQQNHQPRVGRHRGGSGIFDLTSQQEVQKPNNNSVIIEKYQNIWQDNRHNLTRDAQVAYMRYNLIHRINCAIIVEPSEGQAEFTLNPPQKHLIDSLINTLKSGNVRKNNNRFIVLGDTDISKGNAIPESIRPFSGKTNSDFWITPYFQQQFFYDEKDEQGNPVCCLHGVGNSDGAVFVLPEPAADDIKNAFQYWRIVNSRSWKIEWSEVIDIVSQLSIARGNKDEFMTHSLDQWEKTFRVTDVISIDALETFGVHKVIDSDVVSFDNEKLINDLKAIKGQEDNVAILVDEINTWIRDSVKDAPLVFMLAGTSGTGKTYTAEIIDSALKEYKLVKLHMNEYQSRADAMKLLGSPTGHIGSDKDSPIFVARNETDKLIILFDEIEKAHPDLFSTIMTLMEKGEMGNGHGEVKDFKQSIIIFTTNLAMKELLKLKKESIKNNVDPSAPEFQDAAKSLLKKAGLKDEISGRLSWVLVYNTLDASNVAQIALSEIRKLGMKYSININAVSLSYLEIVAKHCADNNEGARPIKRMVTRKVKPILQDAYESGRFSSDKLYDINDNMEIVESASSELVETIDVINELF